MIHLSIVEVRLLVRRRITAFSVLVVPVGLAALVLFGERPGSTAEWGRLLSTHVSLLMMMSVFLVSLTVFTSRRQSRVLKRLRTTELSDAAVLGGVLLPVVAVGLAQTVVFLAFCMATGTPAPDDPGAVVAGVVLSVAVATAAGVATACLSRSVEATQVTGVPVLLAAVTSTFLTASDEPAVAALGLAMPIAGPADLVARGWSAGATVGDLPVVPLDLASAVLWLAAAGLVWHRTFRWEPRG